MTKTINGNDVTIQDPNNQYNIFQFGPGSTFLNGQIDSSYVYQTGTTNIAFINGSLDYSRQYGSNNVLVVSGDYHYGYMSASGANASNFASMQGYGNELITGTGRTTAYFYGNDGYGQFGGPTTLNVTGNYGSWYGSGTIAATIQGDGNYVRDKGGDISITGNYNSLDEVTTNGARDTIDLSTAGVGNSVYWNGDGASKNSLPDQMNFVSGAGSTDVVFTGGDVTALLTAGSYTRIDATGADHLTVVTFGNNVDFNVTAGNVPVNFYNLDTLLANTYSGGKGGAEPVGTSNFSAAGTLTSSTVNQAAQQYYASNSSGGEGNMF